MDIKQQEEIMKEVQRVQEQLEKSGALKTLERINSDSSIKNAIEKMQELKENSILNSIPQENIEYLSSVSQKIFESIGEKTIGLFSKISISMNDYLHQEMNKLGDVVYSQCRDSLNTVIKQLDIFNSINQLRSKIPNYFLYEHNDPKFYDDEIYEVVFQNTEDWKLQIEDDTFAISFKKEELTLQGSEIKDVASIEQLFPDLNLSTIVNFISHLRKFPFLSLQSDVGLLIFNRLKEKAENHCIIIESGSHLYRARELKDDNIFSTDESMLEPDTGIPNIGRFNPYGVPSLYLSEDWETAKLELNTNKFQVAQIEIKKSLRIIDLKKSGGLVYKFCNKSLNSKDYNPDEYMLPNFLAQCASYLKNECEIELDGFKYESTKNKGKYCYALFDVHKPNIQISDICYKKST
ncbi:MAG: RES domain-containing protein [Spirochaetaceae bacterium]|nr:RES domain-containing protein [Spirochaetaceae bacterium]